MKITIYELLGLVKDGKAPKKIKYGNIKLEYDEDFTDYYKYCNKGFFEYKFTICNDFLNEKVEIIEEPKKIEKLDWDKNDFTYPEGNLMGEETADMLMEMQDKINNIIDILDKGENK